MEQLTGCQASLVRLPGGGKLVTKFLSLQAESASCKIQTVLKLDIQMAGPSNRLIESVLLLFL